MKIVGLLRGINVGTSVRVPMKELKTLMEGLGATEVVTYLNSGNVVFDSDRTPSELRPLVEGRLEASFGQPIPILLLEGTRIVAIRDAIPPGWENDESQQSYVAYLFPEVDRPDLAAELPVKHQYIDLRYVPSALLWNIPRADYNRSQITKIAGHPAYGKMTTRNVNTARKLAELCTAVPRSLP